MGLESKVRICVRSDEPGVGLLVSGHGRDFASFHNEQYNAVLCQKSSNGLEIRRVAKENEEIWCLSLTVSGNSRGKCYRRKFPTVKQD